MNYIIFKNNHPVNAYPEKPLSALGLPSGFEITDEELASLGCYRFIDSEMPGFDCNLFYPIENWEVNGIDCTRTWTLGNQGANESWEYIKSIRKEKLSSCDWTVALDSPLSSSQKQAWIEYRQALRDIPQTYETAQSVIWPNPPQS